MTQETRIERDSMGEMQVPIDAYYGASTQRAVLNFPISSLRFPRAFIRALGQIKQAAAQTNEELGTVDGTIAEAIVKAAQEVIDGKLDAHFVLDIFQTGSGTSTNMNANEVIANRASELLGGSRGSRKVHPNDHVNFGQSSNDVIPSAIHLSALVSIEKDLAPALQELQQALQEKADEFMPVIKTGRTHLQDATPIRLGQEFLGYVGQIERGIARVRHAQGELAELALGGTAVGTGVNTHPEFSARVCQRLSQANGIEVRETSNHFQAQSTLDNVVEASGALNTLAVSLMKIANDIRWLGSGPRAGIGEIELPAVQPGSSIMPGKVNPVIAESVCMVCAQVIGNHTTITVAGQAGNFEINVMMPVTAYNLLQSIELLAASARNFTRQCIKGLKATTKGPEMVERGLAICTSLAPVIGYDAAAAISKEAHKTGKTIREVTREKTDLSEADLDRILDPSSMTRPGLDGGPTAG
ncbi:aspartate ammonia-lyase [Ktedonobacter sp. SOSP1-85]|uniref:class II fumarate hydratase n=1 Tax=Ktedonobacter sp. SOSP1-85 TaxID=2778367 RepID=UPI001F38955A|nr:class II fumarate hydratase [Ktedonobacter sp. SOSP1-85]